MSHHLGKNDNHPAEFPKDFLEKLREASGKFGPPAKTHVDDAAGATKKLMETLNKRYPNGMMNDEDQGAVQVLIGTENGRVKMMFPSPMAWIGLEPGQAVGIAELLIKHARKVAKAPLEIKL